MISKQLLMCVLITLTICFFSKIVKALPHTPPKNHHHKADVDTNQLQDSTLLDSIKSLRISFPLIALAQAKFESANYHSRLYRINHNLFGMRFNKYKETTAIGENLYYAKYTSWYQSLKDYQLWQQRTLKKVQTQSEYLRYIGKHYSQDSLYLHKLNKIIAKLEVKYS